MSFVSGLVNSGDLVFGSVWDLSERKDKFLIKGPKSIISIRKRNSYPTTFVLKNNQSFIGGYIEPLFFSSLERRISKNTDFQKIIGWLDKIKKVEYLLVNLDFGKNRLQIKRDSVCALPIFYKNQGDKFSFSNEFTDLLEKSVDIKTGVNIKSLTEYLLGLESGRHSVIEGLKLLTERSLLIKKAKTLAIKFPNSNKLAARDKKSGAVKNFSKQLESAIKRYWLKTNSFGAVGLELSGGLDSSTVAGLCSELSPSRLTSFSMQFPGEFGKSQSKKLADISKRFNINSKKIKISKEFPFSEQLKNKKIKPFYPLREIYYEALKKQAGVIKRSGVEVLFTGMGGDELFKIDRGENRGFRGKQEIDFRKNIDVPKFFTKKFKSLFYENLGAQDKVPVPIVPYSVLGSNFSRNNIFIDQGVWPVAPLAYSELVAFCRSLPLGLRENKKIMRDYQTSKDFPKSVTLPQINEDFSDFFDNALRGPLKKNLIKLYSNSILADELGLLDKKQLLSEFLAFTKKSSDINPLFFYLVASVEILLKSLVQP